MSKGEGLRVTQALGYLDISGVDKIGRQQQCQGDSKVSSVLDKGEEGEGWCPCSHLICSSQPSWPNQLLLYLQNPAQGGTSGKYSLTPQPWALPLVLEHLGTLLTVQCTVT